MRLKILPPNSSQEYKVSSEAEQMRNLIQNLAQKNDLYSKENNRLLREAREKIKEDNKSQSIQISAEICADTEKLLIVDLIVIITILRYLIKYIITPLIRDNYSSDVRVLKKILRRYISKYTNSENRYIFILYILIIFVFLSLSNFQFQNIGIIMFITFITTLTAEADQLLTGALVSGIIVYLFIRIRTTMISPGNKIQYCNVSIITALKNSIENLYNYIFSKKINN